MKIKRALFALGMGLLLLALQPVSAQDTLYGVSEPGNVLYIIAPATGEPAAVAPLLDSGIRLESLSFHPDGTLYSVDVNSDRLVTVDTATGDVNPVGTGLGFGRVRSIAFDSSGTLYGVDTDTNQLVTIDTTTGEAEAIGPGPLGFENVIGLDFDSNDQLYGVDSTGSSNGQSDQLLTIDTATGTATAVGSPLGFIFAQALAFDCNDTLYSIDFSFSSPQELLTVDTTSGVATAVGEVGISDRIRGLAFEPLPDTDTDGDGVPDEFDLCPESIVTETVEIDGIDTGVENTVDPVGCTIADLVKGYEEDAKNHGGFVSSVAALANSLKRSGEISAADKASLQKAAAKSGIGK